MRKSAPASSNSSLERYPYNAPTAVMPAAFAVFISMLESPTKAQFCGAMFASSQICSTAAGFGLRGRSGRFPHTAIKGISLTKRQRWKPKDPGVYLTELQAEFPDLTAISVFLLRHQKVLSHRANVLHIPGLRAQESPGRVRCSALRRREWLSRSKTESHRQPCACTHQHREAQSRIRQ